MIIQTIWTILVFPPIAPGRHRVQLRYRWCISLPCNPRDVYFLADALPNTVLGGVRGVFDLHGSGEDLFLVGSHLFFSTFGSPPLSSFGMGVACYRRSKPEVRKRHSTPRDQMVVPQHGSTDGGSKSYHFLGVNQPSVCGMIGGTDVDIVKFDIVAPNLKAPAEQPLLIICETKVQAEQAFQLPTNQRDVSG